MDLIAAFGAFARVAELGSFSAASRALELPQSAVSRQVVALEEHFGIRLFHRTTRRVTLTEDGQDLLEHAHHVLDSVESAEVAVGKRRSTPTGLVHVGTPVAFGLYLATLLPELFRRYPGLEIDLTTRDTPFDLIREGLDVALRMADSADSSLVIRKVGATSRVVVASPAYLERRGEPLRPADLTAHDCIIYNYGTQVHSWTFECASGPVTIPVAGPFRANSSAAVSRAVLKGLGIALLPRIMVDDDIRSGALRALLPGYRPERLHPEIVYPSRRHLAPRTRVVIDFLVSLFPAVDSPAADAGDTLRVA